MEGLLTGGCRHSCMQSKMRTWWSSKRLGYSCLLVGYAFFLISLLFSYWMRNRLSRLFREYACSDNSLDTLALSFAEAVFAWTTCEISLIPFSAWRIISDWWMLAVEIWSINVLMDWIQSLMIFIAETARSVFTGCSKCAAIFSHRPGSPVTGDFHFQGRMNCIFSGSLA